ncbi:MAG: putative bifunctional diguanylate cyclase/phosphodiesterase [Myxococcales bacterium]
MMPPKTSPPFADREVVEHLKSASGRWQTDGRSSATMQATSRVESPHPTIVADETGRVVSINAFAACVLQREEENVCGWRIEDLLGFKLGLFELHPDQIAAPASEATGALSTIPGHARRRDGSTFPVEVTCAAFYHQSSQFIIVHFCDVSARHAAEARLRQLSTALEQTAEHAVITDSNGVVLYVNRAFESASGFSRSAVVGQNMDLLKAETQDPSSYAELWSTLANGRVFQGELVNRNAQGQPYVVEEQIAPFMDSVTGETYYIATGRDVTERRFRDPLTGLPSRAAFMENVSRSIARSERQLTTRPFALGFIDLDRFRNINDAHGTDIGNHVLLEVAFRIRHAVRRVDLVAHVSHLERDEFAVLLEDLRAVEDARRIGQRILDAIREPIQLPSGNTVVVNASIGFALATNAQVTPEVLLHDAETAMRRAKATPDDACQVFDLAMHERARNRLQLEAELRGGIARREFVLHYQPIVSLFTGEITSCEALVRWQHPTRGFVPPLDFIEIAEESGLIVPLGQLILETACGQARRWRDLGTAGLSVAVNISTRQLTEGQLVETVRQCLQCSGLTPEMLKLEITESVAARKPAETIATLNELRDLGVQLLMDDFGTGYSSLSRLSGFPLHKLKIDRSFVTHLPHNAQDEAIASTIVAMAHGLGLEVIAEGVETVEQARFLRSIGCEEMQGYLFSKAVEASAFTQLLQSGKRLNLD